VQIPSVVVYGRTFDAYAAIEQLLSRGVPGSRLVLVRPPAHNSPVSVCDDGCGDPFNEPVIMEAVMKSLNDAGVRVLSDHVLASWQVEPTDTGEDVTNDIFRRTSLVAPNAVYACFVTNIVLQGKLLTFHFD